MYWLAASAFLGSGAVALLRPELMLRIRARFRSLENTDPLTRRRGKFGVREVRICGAALVFIGVALVHSLVR